MAAALSNDSGLEKAWMLNIWPVVGSMRAMQGEKVQKMSKLERGQVPGASKTLECMEQDQQVYDGTGTTV